MLAALAIGFSNGIAADAEDTLNQQSMKIDLLVVTAHPDDESMMAATMARYADKGKGSLLSCAPEAKGAAIARVRRAEC